MRTIVFDLDGVLIDSSHRFGLIEKDEDEFYSYMGQDTPIEPMYSIVKNMVGDYYIVLLTGRPSYVAPGTKEWLNKYQVPYDTLIMRPTTAYGLVSDFKLSVLRNLEKSGKEIVGYFEDNPMTAEVCKEAGYNVIAIDSGYYNNYDPQEFFDETHVSAVSESA